LRYVYLGGDLVVAAQDIVALLDVRLLQASDVNREFMDRAAADRRLRGGPPDAGSKALVVTHDGVFASALSIGTLARRMTYLRWSAQGWEQESPR
jgi:hypothetical protein